MNLRALTVVTIQTNYNLIKKCTHRAVRRFDLMLLEDVFNDVGERKTVLVKFTVQSLKFNNSWIAKKTDG